ncbi:MAG: hypothetical protein KC684_00815 [Candidatus Omnitrophica bacterium]|nr:hypothetical protein [Candidatus Omnitrophota bacterium]
MNDLEDLLVSVKDYLKSNLNTKIASINTEKTAGGSDFVIDTITADDSHYLISGTYREIPGHDFVSVALFSQPELLSNYDVTKITAEIMVEVVIANAKNAQTYYKSLRYMRALYETLERYELSTIEVGGLQLTGASPMEVTTNRRELVISGVILSIAIA